MKRLSFFLVVCLILLSTVSTTAMEPFQYESKTLGFSITVPDLPAEEIAVEEYETGIRLFHAPSQEKWGGLIGSIEVVSPRDKFFSEQYTDMAYQVISMGKDRIFLFKSSGGGVNTGHEMLEAFAAASSALSVESLKKCLTPMRPDDQPLLSKTRHLKYLMAASGEIRPDAPLTRGELAEMLYALLDASNKGESYESPFSDVGGKSYAQAVAYLSSYGILSGYKDGTFRPDASVSRAQFAVLLHRCQFAAPVRRYGDTLSFADMPDSYWAEEYIYSANILGWMTGYSDSKFYPSKEITRAQAVVAINRLLGRDESYTDVSRVVNPFSDLDVEHWAYGNMLEASGFVPVVLSESCEPKSESLPKETSAYYFVSNKEGWAVSKSQLQCTTNGGETWTPIGKSLAFTVFDIFFFNNQEGLLLGSSADTPYVLMLTTDGGETWSDFLANPTAQELHFPAKQFPTKKSMLNAIASAEFRPASKDAVYLTIRYHPYESVYVLAFEVVKQSAIMVEEIRTNPVQAVSATSQN